MHVKRDRWIVRNLVAATWEGIVPVIGNRLFYRIEEPPAAIGSHDVIDDIAVIVAQDRAGLPALQDHGPSGLFGTWAPDIQHLIRIVAHPSPLHVLNRSQRMSTPEAHLLWSGDGGLFFAREM